MIRSLLRESESLWEHLRRTDKPIYLYGMGNGAEKVIAALERVGVSPAGVFASDGFVRGHSFHGMQVLRYDQVQAEHGGRFIALLCFGINYEPMLSRLGQIDRECEFYAPDVPVIPTGDALFDYPYLCEHEAELDEVYAHLADVRSKETFLALLEFKLSGKLPYLQSVFSDPAEAYRDILRPTGEETILDLGAFTGDTIREYLSCAGSCRRILALEPDAKNARRLTRYLSGLPIPSEVYPAAAWDRPDMLFFQGGKGGRNSALCSRPNPAARQVRADSVDHILQGRPVDLIKMDVEGAERRALEGARETIRRFSPKLIVSAYHKTEDLFALPLQILEIQPDYRLYLRQRPYIPAWDTNYYFRKA